MHESLVSWGRHAFEKGFSLEHIESYLLKRGLKRSEALEMLHNVTAFEHNTRHEAKNIKKELMLVLIIALLIILVLGILDLSGILDIW